MDIKYTDHSETRKAITKQNAKNLQDIVKNNVLQQQQHRPEQCEILLIQTPPTSRPFPRIRNPFESALTERLHLPLIARYT